MCSQNRSGAGAAVVDEGDGPRWIFAIGAEVGSGIDEGLRLVLFILEHDGLRDGFVGDGLAADFDGVFGGGGFFFSGAEVLARQVFSFSTVFGLFFLRRQGEGSKRQQ